MLSLCYKIAPCNPSTQPTYYCFGVDQKIALTMDCVLACAAEGKSASPEFYFVSSDPHLCYYGGGSRWVDTYVERFKCHCIGCPDNGGDNSNTG